MFCASFGSEEQNVDALCEGFTCLKQGDSLLILLDRVVITATEPERRQLSMKSHTISWALFTDP